MTWRLARSLDVLRNEANTRWPGRSKISDGTLGDQAHSTRKSDHNPDRNGVVRAFDITSSGIDPNWYAEHIRQLGKSGDARLNPAGYVIWNRRVASSQRGWNWHPYTGTNPHDHHVHVSVTTTPAGYDSTVSWGLLGRTIPPPSEELFTVSQYEELNRKLDVLTSWAQRLEARIEELEDTRWKPSTRRGRQLVEHFGIPDQPDD